MEVRGLARPRRYGGGKDALGKTGSDEGVSEQWSSCESLYGKDPTPLGVFETPLCVSLSTFGDFL